MNPFLLTLLRENLGWILALSIVIVVSVTIFITKTEIGIKALNKNFDGLRKEFKSLREKVDKMYMKIVSAAPVNSSSPLSLTEVGQSVSENLRARDMAARHIKKLKADTGDSEPSPFEIQTKSMNFATEKLMELVSPDEKALLENEAFQRGGGTLKQCWR